MASWLASLLAPSLLLLPSLVITRLVNSIVPEPYMDEIFHVPQAQHYCQGDFYYWDDKITTPPGLYFMSVGLSAVLASAIKENLCSVEFLRMSNLVFGFMITWLVYLLVEKLHPKTAVPLWTRVLNAVAVALFPLQFFFQFLYYTDPGSTFFVLVAYYCLIHRSYVLSSLVSLVSLTFRQTNIIWVCFFFAWGIRNELMLLLEKERVAKDKSSPDKPGTVTEPPTLYYDPLASKSRSRGFVHVLTSFVLLTVRNLGGLPLSLFFFLLPLGSFASFVVWNGGIVLGDKTNHVATLHFPQVFYFVSFTFGLTAVLKLHTQTVVKFTFVFLDQLVSILKLMRLILGHLLGSHLVTHYTVEHPFLLADNRHYPFYLWKNVFRRYPLVKYLAIPFYWFCGWELLINLSQTQTVIWIAGYVVSVTLALVPTPLIEFRYYILPFLFYRLHIQQPRGPRLLAEVLQFALINAVALWLFLMAPFTWEAAPGALQRFMW